ncbi:autotransporter outer membrane beta-barrel domain-containing protein [Dyella sp. AD56]|uniref:autotransporter outer membrane beta-barrel domain-containing protein n=1 Tax=Dyella sp. AD56 TaxID=1528744 RepID=UPI000C84B4F0|nr:autotransporter outer membrane beta-barrel domain-containing protein [Dyella sp. AD56]
MRANSLTQGTSRSASTFPRPRWLVACLLATLAPSAFANCVLQPSGTTVICDTNAPNPFTSSINATVVGTGSLTIPLNGATVAVNAGSGLSTTGAAIQVANNSTVTVGKGGSITTTFINAYGMWAGDPSNASSTTVGYGNTLENDGTIRTNGSNSVGMFARTGNRTAGNTLINRGQIDTYGSISGTSTRASSAGIRSESVVASTILNYGNVAAHGAYATIGTGTTMAIAGNGVEMAGPGTFTNEAGASVTSDNAYGFYGNGPNANGISVTNAGTLSGHLGAVLFGPGQSNNTVMLEAGSTTTGSIDAGSGGSNNTLVFDGFTSTAFANAIPNWQLVALRNSANVTLSAPSYTLTNLSLNAGTTATFNGPALTISGQITDNGSLVFTSASNLSVAAPIRGSGSVTQSGSGTLVLAGAGSYTGPTTVASGTLQAGAANVLSPSSAFTVNSGATLDLGNANQTIGSLAGAGAVTFEAGTLNTGGLGTSTSFSGVASGSGALVKTGAGTMTLTGTNTYTGGTVIANGALQLGDGGTTGSITGNVQNGGTLIFDRSDTVTFNNLISDWTNTTPDPSGSVQQNGTGTTILTATNSYSGTTQVNAGTLIVGSAPNSTAALAGGGAVTVASGATFGGYGNTAGDVNNSGTIAVADALSLFQGGSKGSFTIGGTLTNNNLIQLAGTGVGNTLSVHSLVGQGSSQVAMNTVLGGDGSPTDLLVINGGSASGQTVLNVTNVGGLGAATTGNGIQVVAANTPATSTSGAFVLGTSLKAGPYQYALFEGARDNTSAYSWYLRSENPNPPLPPSEITGTVAPPPPVVTPGEPTPPPVEPYVPYYRSEVSLYAALPSMALNYGKALIGTLHDRVGEEEQLRDLSDDGFGASGVWARVVGQDGEWDAKPGGIYRDGPSFDDNMIAVQAGLDLYRTERTDGGRDFAGVLASVGHGHGGVSNYDNTSAGNNRFDSYSVGGYWTHFGANGWYLDGVLQGTWYDATSTSNQQENLTTHGFGTALSAEGGYPFAFGNGWSLEPQSQLIYQSLHLANAYDSAASVQFRDSDSLAGRIGGRASRTWQWSQKYTPDLLTGWFFANLWHEFKSDAVTAFSSQDGNVPFHSDLGGSWWELGVGGSAVLHKGATLYATVSYDKGFGDGVKALNGSMGMRWNW